MFQEIIGISPERFSQVIRFQSSLMFLDYNSSLQGYEITNDFGFYDQSHFIRFFKKRMGKLPSFVKPSDFYNT
ncbi:Helix-turn-helix domain-containing protein [Lentibacillus halodurans]|uniref:Helix-turn-helix domain-containing protein n=1 Tax=Lentibacillus halodurans TaxID=237679 RepID=A0A1I1AMB5_9BACI|nr:Helix-turn-helix domain-containing protein [Lentibacillus halodurans]